MKIKSGMWFAAVISAGSASAMATGIALQPSYGMAQPSTVSAGPNTATSNANAKAEATTSSAGGAGTGVGSQGQSLSIDSHANYEAQARNPVSTAVAPALTSSNDTCMGSTSVGGSAATFGFSFGSSWTDKNCLMLKNAREIWNMGFKGAALARLCMDDLNKEAFEATGINCPDRKQAKSAQPANSAHGATVNEIGVIDNGYRS